MVDALGREADTDCIPEMLRTFYGTKPIDLQVISETSSVNETCLQL